MMTISDFGKRILYEDNHLMFINKPSGIITEEHPDQQSLERIAKEYVKEKYKKPGDVFLGMIHRLDQPVSGVLATGRTSKGLTRMQALFRAREIEKVYWAIVDHAPPKMEDTLVGYLMKNRAKNKSIYFRKPKENAWYCELSYRLMGQVGKKYWLEVKPKTGRPHQIRVQLASIGCPIVGDLRYGNDPPNDDRSICLHARSLHFIHPISKDEEREMFIKAPVPDNLPYWRMVHDLL